jgi:hypothetical protein
VIAVAQTLSANLFTLSESGNIGETGRAQAAVSGLLTAGGSLYRGIDLSAGLDVTATASAEVRDGLAASVSAGAGARVGSSLRAVFPLDLFDQAGVVAGLRLQAEASAFIRATVGLELSEFRQLVRERVARPWNELLEIFFDEVTVEAGMWGRASFAAQLMAEATVVGNFVTLRDGTPPGIQCSARAAAGFGFGAGYDFVANLGIDDPRRLLSRLGDRILTELDHALTDLVQDLPGDQAEAAAVGLTLTRLIFPLAVRAAIDAGFDLAEVTPQSVAAGGAGQRTVVAVVDAVVHEAQVYLLRALFELGATRLAAALGSDDLVTALQGLAAQARAEVVESLRQLDQAIDTIEAATAQPSLEAWLSSVVAFLEPAERVVTLAGMTGADREAVEAGLALLWSSAVLLKHCLTTPVGQWLTAELAESRDGSAVAARVATEIAKPAGSGLTVLDLVRYVATTDPLDALETEFPVMSPVVAWIRGALGARGATPFQRIFEDLSPGNAVVADGLMPGLARAVSDVVEERIVPDLLERLGRADPSVGRLIDEAVTPCITAFGKLILARLGELDDLDDVRRLREQISANLLALLSRYVLAAFDVLLERALDEAGDSMRRAGDEVSALAGGSPVFGIAIAASSLGLLGTSLHPDDVRDALHLAADAIDHWAATQRKPLFELLQALVGLGLITGDADLEAVWNELESSNDPLRADDLNKLLERLVSAAVDLVGFVVPRAALIWLQHWVRVGQDLLELVEEGAKAAIKAIETAVDWLMQTIEQLKARAAQLLKNIATIVGQIAAGIANLSSRLQQLAASFVEEVRKAGWSLVDAAIPKELQWLKDAFRLAYNVAFDTVKWILTTPIALLGSIATWIHQELSREIVGGAASVPALTSAASAKVTSSWAPNLQFPVRIETFAGPIDLGTVTLPASSVLTSIVTVVFNDGSVKGSLAGLASAGNSLAQTQNELSATQAAIDGHLTTESAQTAVSDLVTGRPLVTTITAPLEGRGYHDHAGLRLKVDGANMTYVDAVAGLPRRVRVRINGLNYDYAPSAWRVEGTGIIFDATIVASEGTLAPGGLQGPYDLFEIALADGVDVVTPAGGGRLRIEREAASTPATTELPSPTGFAQPVAATMEEPPLVTSPVRPRAVPVPEADVPVVGAIEMAPLADAALLSRLTSIRRSQPFASGLPEPGGVVLIDPEGSRGMLVATGASGTVASGWDVANGYQMRPVGDLEEVIIGPPIPGVAGLNTVELFAADGRGARQHTVRTFYLT